MANTYTQFYVHIVFSVKNRELLIPAANKEELHKYIVGIVRNQKCKLIAINSMPDHIHMLCGINPDVAVSALVRDVKSHSTAFINSKKWIKTKFSWQVGFGAFTYSHSQLTVVIRYIENQEHHHRRVTFKDEYLRMLQNFKIKYEGKYVFDLD